ncbi:MAG: CoA transferase, partial [Sulfobacillus sp.]
MTQTELGLAGIHVLDLSRVLAAPYATMALGDLGAEIIKIERPGSGDETREWGPPFWGDQSAYFLSANRNKKSCVVDLTTEEGRDLVRTLALQWADVVVENFKPGALLRYQIDLAGMRKVNPRLITASL